MAGVKCNKARTFFSPLVIPAFEGMTKWDAIAAASV